MPHPDYVALRHKVDAFAAGVAERRDDLRCRIGCASCCHVELALCDVEAEALSSVLRVLDAPTRALLTEALAAQSEAAQSEVAEGAETPCVLLDRHEGRCLAYEGRPLVCRTQGLPLRYPAGFVPLAAVRARAEDAEVVWCPLNFDQEAPAAADVLDAERVDTMLALINRQVTGPENRLRRTAIRTLVERALCATDRDVR